MNVRDLIFSSSFLFMVIRVATPLLFATMASVVSTTAGTVNILLEGMMLVASLAGVLVSAATQSVILGVGAAVISSVLVACLMAMMTIRFQSNATLCGLAINMFASGGTVFFLYVFTGAKGNSSSIPSLVVPTVELPLIKEIPFLADVLSGHNILTYLAILSSIFVIILLKKTPHGIRLQAVGHNPNAARSIGISVSKMQMSAWILSGALCGFAGAFLSMGYVSWFTRDMTAGRGWIALAACSLGQGKPGICMLTALMFAAAEAVANVLGFLNLPGNLINTLPYCATLVVLVSVAVTQSKKVK